MNMDEIEYKVIEVVSRVVILGESEKNMIKYFDLFEDIGVGSLEYVSIIIALEEAFGIIIPDEYLTMDRYRTIDNIVDIVKKSYFNR